MNNTAWIVSFFPSIDWDDDTWYPERQTDDDDQTWHPDMETESVSSLEEDQTREIDTDYDDSDEDYMPRICVR